MKLKPCPFCGDKDIEVVREGTRRQSCVVSCEECGCTVESNEIGSGQFWNMREQAEVSEKEIVTKALKRFCEIVAFLDCECDDDNGFTCSIHKDRELVKAIKKLMKEKDK